MNNKGCLIFGFATIIILPMTASYMLHKKIHCVTNIQKK